MTNVLRTQRAKRIKVGPQTHRWWYWYMHQTRDPCLAQQMFFFFLKPVDHLAVEYLVHSTILL